MLRARPAAAGVPAMNEPLPTPRGTRARGFRALAGTVRDTRRKLAGYARGLRLLPRRPRALVSRLRETRLLLRSPLFDRWY